MPLPTPASRPARALFERLFGPRVAPRRPSLLGLTQLEDRVVPTAVGPQSWWDDGHDDGHGNRVGITVSLHNWGPGWLDASGGGGHASVSRGTPPPPDSGSGSGSGGPPPDPIPNPANYSFEVYGSLGDGSGDVTWSGRADSLYIKASGDIDPVSIAGDLWVDAGWTVGALAGKNVGARAGKSVGAVTATLDVTGVAAGTTAGAVTAGRDVLSVTAGAGVGVVAATRDVGTVSAGKDVASVSAGGHVLTVSAGRDVLGAVSAGTFVGGYSVTTGDWSAWQYAPFGGGVSAGRDIGGAVTAAAGGIASVRAGGRVQGAVTAAGDIWSVSSGGGYDPDANSGYGSGSGGPTSPPLVGRIAGPVNAGRDVHFVWSTGDIAGPVSGGRSVTAVNAGGSVLGAVTATLDIGRRGDPDANPTWRPGLYDPYWSGYGWSAPLGAGVQARDGSVLAGVSGGRDVTAVSAGQRVQEAVTAGRDVGDVSGGTGVFGAVTATRDIGSVSAGGYGSGYGSGGSYAVPYPVAKTVEAGRDIGSVWASGDVLGTVAAGHGVGGVSAGGSVRGAVTAGAAVGRTDDADPRLARFHPYQSYGSPYSGGVRAGGDVLGAVMAGTDVSIVEAGGAVSGAVSAGRDIGFVHGTGGVAGALDAGRDVGNVYAGGYGYWGYYWSWGELPGGAESSVAGSVTAGGEIYGVFATADVAGRVRAGRGVGQVRAKGSVTGDVTAGLSVGYAGDEGSGSGSGGGVWGGVSAGVDVLGKVTAGQSVGQVSAARGKVTQSVSAGSGSVGSVTAGTDILGSITAGTWIGGVTAGTVAGGRIAGVVTACTNIGDVTAYGTGGQAGSPWSRPLVEAGSATSGRLDVSLWTIDADADRYEHGQLGAAVPFAPNLPLGGDITGDISAGGTLGRVVAFGHISGDLVAGGSIGVAPLDPASGVWAAGPISGDVSSGAGDLVVRSWGAISGDLTAEGHLRTWAYGELSGDLTSRASDILAGSWAGVSGGAEAALDIDLRSPGDVGVVVTQSISTTPPEGPEEPAPEVKSLNSHGGVVKVWAGHDALAPIEAEKSVAVYGKDKVAIFGRVRSRGADVFVESGGDLMVAGSLGQAGSGATARDLVWLKSGGDLAAYPVTSEAGSIVADAAGSITSLFATAKRNVWAAARGSSAEVRVVASDGWAYAWASGDLSGSVKAKRTVSVTAWGDMSAQLSSSDDIVEAFAGKDLKGSVSGAQGAVVEARGTVSASVEAGVNGYDGDAIVRAGINVTGNVTASGEADVAAEGSVRANVTSTNDDVIVVANGDIEGELRAGWLAEVTAGGSIGGSVVAEEEINIEGKTGVSARVESITASASVWSGADVGGSVKAGYEAFVEAIGAITASVTADYTASVVAGGNITGQVTAEWLADVRSATGEVTGQVKTGMDKPDRLGKEDSPTKRRLAVIGTQLQALASDPNRNAEDYDALMAEKELHELENRATNLSNLPATRIRAMINDGLAKEETGPPIVEVIDHPLIPNRTQEVNGYVVVADVIGTQGVVTVLEPYRSWTTVVYGLDGRHETFHAESVLGHTQDATHYKVVKQQLFIDITLSVDPDVFRQQQTTPQKVRMYAEAAGSARLANSVQALSDTVNFAFHLLPLAGAVDEFVQGNYTEAGISLASDIAMFTGLGAAAKGAKCVYSGSKIVKFASRASAAIEGGIVATRMGQGFNALSSDDAAERQKAWGYFGDATLRMFGLSASAIHWLKEVKCFVAGTPVDTEYGLKPIESVHVGERVWAYDRQLGEWRLCAVSHTFVRRSHLLTTMTLADGDVVTGTDGHPIWVVEGDDLLSRADGDHGQDESPGRTPGRWVAMAALRPGDAVLTRAGVARVASVVTRAESVPVYNLSVEGLHSYAVGGSGILVHNANERVYNRDALGRFAKSAPEPRTPPKVETGTKGVVPEKTPPAATAGVVKEATAPAAKSVKPATAGKQRAERAPNTNGDKRIGDPKASHQFQRSSELDEFPGTTPTRGKPRKEREVPFDERTPELEADLAEWHRLKKLKGDAPAGGVPDANVPIGRVGVTAADGYMAKHLGKDSKVAFTRSGNGNREFDLVYKKGDTYYVVEAKAGPYGRETSRKTGDLLENGNAAYAIQGSDKYLDMTITDMAATGSQNVALGEALQSAKAVGKLVYLNIHTKPVGVGEAASALRQTIKRYEVKKP